MTSHTCPNKNGRAPGIDGTTTMSCSMKAPFTKRYKWKKRHQYLEGNQDGVSVRLETDGRCSLLHSLHGVFNLVDTPLSRQSIQHYAIVLSPVVTINSTLRQHSKSLSRQSIQHYANILSPCHDNQFNITQSF